MLTIEILQQYFYCLQAEEEVLLSVDEAETWSYFASSLLPQNSTKKHATQHDGSQDEVKLEEETEEKLCKPCCDLILAHFHQRFPSRLPPTSYKPTNNTANTTNTASSSSSSSGNGSGNVRKKATTRMQLAINLPTHHSGYKTIEVAMPEIFLPMYKSGGTQNMNEDLKIGQQIAIGTLINNFTCFVWYTIDKIDYGELGMALSKSPIYHVTSRHQCEENEANRNTQILPYHLSIIKTTTGYQCLDGIDIIGVYPMSSLQRLPLCKRSTKDYLQLFTSLLHACNATSSNNRVGTDKYTTEQAIEQVIQHVLSQATVICSTNKDIKTITTSLVVLVRLVEDVVFFLNQCNIEANAIMANKTKEKEDVLLSLTSPSKGSTTSPSKRFVSSNLQETEETKGGTTTPSHHLVNKQHIVNLLLQLHTMVINVFIDDHCIPLITSSYLSLSSCSTLLMALWKYQTCWKALLTHVDFKALPNNNSWHATYNQVVESTEKISEVIQETQYHWLQTTFTFSVMKQDWASHSPYMRNRRISPSITMFTTQLTNLTMDFLSNTAIEAVVSSHDSNCVVFINMCKCLFNVLHDGFELITTTYFFWESSSTSTENEQEDEEHGVGCIHNISRIRLLQWKVDVNYALACMSSLLQVIASYLVTALQQLQLTDIPNELFDWQVSLELLEGQILCLQWILFLHQTSNLATLRQSVTQILSYQKNNNIKKDTSPKTFANQLIALHQRLQSSEVIDKLHLDDFRHHYALQQQASSPFAFYDEDEKKVFDDEMKNIANNHVEETPSFALKCIAYRMVLFHRFSNIKIMNPFFIEKEENEEESINKMLKAMHHSFCIDEELLPNSTEQRTEILKRMIRIVCRNRYEMIDVTYPPLKPEEIQLANDLKDFLTTL